MTDLPHPLIPGIYDLADEIYHGDPCPEPSFSAGIGKLLSQAAPMHVANEHPRLVLADLPPAEDEEEEAAGKFDIGKAAHALHTGKGGAIVEITSHTKDGVVSKSKNTSAWKEQAEAARAAGAIPLLSSEAKRVRTMVDRSRAQLLEGFGYDPFAKVEHNELAMIWQDGPTWCRAKPDVLDYANRVAWDLKTTFGYADPQPWSETQDRSSMIALRAAHYLRGLGKLLGPDWRYRFWVVEAKRPHCAVAVELPGSMLERGENQRYHAQREFAHCLALEQWRGWARGVVVVDDPAYAEGKWLMRRDNRPTEAALEIAREMQAPPQAPQRKEPTR